jgi:hypothetical protein
VTGTTAYAAETDEFRRSGGGWHLASRVVAPRLDALNAEAAENGFDNVSRVDVLVGPAVDLVIGRTRLALEGLFDPSAATIRDEAGNTARRRIGAGLASVGYDVLHGPLYSIFPVLTAGIAHSSMTVTPGATPILVEELSSFTDRTDVSRVAFVASAGLGASFMIPVSKASPTDRRRVVTQEGIRIGVEVGYFIDVAEQAWRRRGTPLASSPEGTLGGPQLRFAVGYGTDQRIHGSCETLCGRVPHATRTCDDRVCSFICHEGFGDCDGDPRNGCERPLDTLDDCGACGEACSVEHGHPTCGSASCEIARCDEGFASCDGFALTGCETDLRSSSAHCGTCFTACDPASTCERGVCVPSATIPDSPSPE